MTTGASLAKKNGYPEATDADHTCPGCGAPMICEYKIIATARAHARGELIAAGHLERKLMGLPSGRPPRKLDLTPEQCQDLVAKLGNINRARKTLGVGWATFYRQMTGDKTRR